MNSLHQLQHLIRIDTLISIVTFIFANSFFHCIHQTLVLPWVFSVCEILIEALAADAKHTTIR